MFWQSRGFQRIVWVLVGLSMSCKKSPPQTAPVGMPPLQEPAAEHAAMPPGHPALPTGPSALPSGHPSINQAAPVATDKTPALSGILHVDNALKSKIPQHGVIFLMARQADVPGPPLAAKKLPLGVWPQRFEMGADDVMLEGGTLTGTVIITARVDQDGDAMTKDPGDLVATSRAVTVPSKQLVLTFDKLL